MPDPAPPPSAVSLDDRAGEPPPSEPSAAAGAPPPASRLTAASAVLLLPLCLVAAALTFASPGVVVALVLLACLAVAAQFSCLSAALLRTLPSMLASGRHGEDTLELLEDQLGADLERAEGLAASASMAAFTCRAAAVVTLHEGLGHWFGLEALPLAAATVAVGGPLLHLTTQSIPLAFAQAHGERVLADVLPLLGALLRPLGWIIAPLTVARRALLRMTATPDADHGTRRLVEGFRALVEEAELGGDLGEEAQELIANVIDFSGADAAEVMTPRTEMRAIPVGEPLSRAFEVFAESGFSRIPVYGETVDTIVGTLTALEAAKAVAEDRLEDTSIADIMRPPLLVPETKLVSELLADFREQRQKMAIVVDEYGGTAGLVTLADVMAEILGDVHDEFAGEEQRVVELGDGRVQLDASLHVSEVNDALGLRLPEESDFETLAGFVLSVFGRFPAEGEGFDRDGRRFVVTSASDRRVLAVTVERAASTDGASRHAG